MEALQQANCQFIKKNLELWKELQIPVIPAAVMEVQISDGSVDTPFACTVHFSKNDMLNMDDHEPEFKPDYSDGSDILDESDVDEPGPGVQATMTAPVPLWHSAIGPIWKNVLRLFVCCSRVCRCSPPECTKLHLGREDLRLVLLNLLCTGKCAWFDTQYDIALRYHFLCVSVYPRLRTYVTHRLLVERRNKTRHVDVFA